MLSFVYINVGIIASMPPLVCVGPGYLQCCACVACYWNCYILVYSFVVGGLCMMWILFLGFWFFG